MPVHETAPDPRKYAEQTLANAQATLKAAVAIVSPENPNIDPQVRFPNPNVPLRAGGEEPMKLTDEQKEQLMAEADKLGFGRPESVGLSEQGLQGSVAVIEGGQPHKMLAEALLVANDPNAASLKTIIVTASAQRAVESEAEIASAVNLFGGDQTGKTEYDMALQVLHALPAFREPIEGGEVSGTLNFAYDIHDGYKVSEETTGQMVRVGSLGPTTLFPHVNLLRVDREDYIDNGKPRYRNQPNTAELIGLIDAALRQGGDRETPIAFVTSGVYRPSRGVLTALAGLKNKRHVGLATYGNDLVNEVRGTDLPAPVKQLPGELQYMAEMSVDLKAALQAIED